MIFMLCLLLWQPANQSQQILRYHGQVIQVGDDKLQVLRRLGNPDTMLTTEVTYIYGDPELGQREIVVEQQWFYNLGARKQTVILHFENKILTYIERGLYGMDESNIENCRVPLSQLKGRISPEILMTCGEPDYVDVSYAQRTEKLGRENHRQYDVRIEEWTYNFGPNHFLRTLIFENGVLIDTYRGERGW